MTDGGKSSTIPLQWAQSGSILSDLRPNGVTPGSGTNCRVEQAQQERSRFRTFNQRKDVQRGGHVLAYLRKLPCVALATLTVAGAPSLAHAVGGATDEGSAEIAGAAPTTPTAGPAEPGAPEGTSPAAADPTSNSDSASAATDETPATTAKADEQGTTCLTKTICAVKDKIRWQTPAWTPSQCKRVSDAVATAENQYDLSPSLLLAIMINESDMNERAVRIYTRNGRVYAKDGGLMGIRCILDNHDRCLNGELRGMAWKTLMDPVTNIGIGARVLAHYRDGGGVMRKTIVKRGADGTRRVVEKEVTCSHKNHAFWAHYNHGPRYIDRGYARHYPHRIAVLDRALATVMNVATPELESGHITVRDPGKRERTPDRPIEPRYKKLTNQILSSGSCSPLALN
jgi:Transglycosylase SLT domain